MFASQTLSINYLLLPFSVFPVGGVLENQAPMEIRLRRAHAEQKFAHKTRLFTHTCTYAQRGRRSSGWGVEIIMVYYHPAGKMGQLWTMLSRVGKVWCEGEGSGAFCGIKSDTVFHFHWRKWDIFCRKVSLLDENWKICEKESSSLKKNLFSVNPFKGRQIKCPWLTFSSSIQ